MGTVAAGDAVVPGDGGYYGEWYMDGVKTWRDREQTGSVLE